MERSHELSTLLINSSGLLVNTASDNEIILGIRERNGRLGFKAKP